MRYLLLLILVVSGAAAWGTWVHPAWWVTALVALPFSYGAVLLTGVGREEG